MSTAVTLPAGAELCHLPALPLAQGGDLRSAVLAFERQGPPDAPAVVVLGGISAGRHVSAHARAPGPGWWDSFVGDGLPVDTQSFQVLAVDWLGGIGASSGPSSGSAGSGAPFPAIATDDQADAVAALLDELRIQRLAAWIGCSYGGMVGLQFAARHPQRLERLLAVAAAHRSHPQASAWRAVQRGVVELGQAHGCERQALALARQLAMTTYRSPREFAVRFAEAPVQDWLAHHGEAFAARWSAAAFLCLLRSIDAHRVDPAQVAVDTWLAAFDSDQLVPAADVRALARALPRCAQHRELPTVHGHDAFLKERRLLAPLLREVLS
jgi:homoserine O-acetyltransferase